MQDQGSRGERRPRAPFIPGSSYVITVFALNAPRVFLFLSILILCDSVCDDVSFLFD